MDDLPFLFDELFPSTAYGSGVAEHRQVNELIRWLDPCSATSAATAQSAMMRAVFAGSVSWIPWRPEYRCGENRSGQ